MDQEGANPFENSSLAIVFNVIRYVVFLGLYVGFGAVCVGVFLFKPPAGVWDGPIPPVAPAVACTMILAVTFFMIYFLVAVSRTYSQSVQHRGHRSYPQLPSSGGRLLFHLHHH